MTWAIELTSTALSLLEAVRDRRVREKIRERIDGLTHDPEKQGKPLIGELSGLRSLRAIGQRYRVVYKIVKNRVVVTVVAVGIRKEGDRSDIYALAQKLLRSGLV